MRARHTPTHRRTGPSARTTRYTTLDLSRRTQKMFAQRTTAKVAPSAMRATASRGGRAVQARAGADRKMWCVARRRARGTVDDASVGGNFFVRFASSTVRDIGRDHSSVASRSMAHIRISVSLERYPLCESGADRTLSRARDARGGGERGDDDGDE